MLHGAHLIAVLAILAVFIAGRLAGLALAIVRDNYLNRRRTGRR